MKARRSSSLFLMSLVAGAVLLQTACSKKEAESGPEVTVQAAKVEKRSIRQVIRTEAVLYPKNQAAITPKIVAPVKTFYVNRGSRVHEGQLLAVLENRDLAAAETDTKGSYHQAEANYQIETTSALPEEWQKAEYDLKAAKENLDAQQKIYDNRKKLYDEGALPRKDYDQSLVALTQAKSQFEIASMHMTALQAAGKKQQLKSAEGQLSSAKGKYEGAAAQLEYSEIRSPIDGVVTDRPTYPGETPPPGTPLLTVMDTSSLIAKAHIPQDQAGQLKPGNAATIKTPGDIEVEGKVTLVSPALDPNSTTVEVWVEAPNPDGRLRPGASVTLEMARRQGRGGDGGPHRERCGRRPCVCRVEDTGRRVNGDGHSRRKGHPDGGGNRHPRRKGSAGPQGTEWKRAGYRPWAPRPA